MRRSAKLALTVGMLLSLALVGAAASATAQVRFDKIPDYDLTQLGFQFEPLGLLTAAAELPEADARAAAAKVLNAAGTPEVQRLRARILPDEPKQSVYVVVYDGGSSFDVPWGPVSTGLKPLDAPVYSGAVIDDRTGEVLVTFRGGHQ